MKPTLFGAALALSALFEIAAAAGFTPAAQQFRQEVAGKFGLAEGLPQAGVQLIDCTAGSPVRAFTKGHWYEFRNGHWQTNEELTPRTESEFAFPSPNGEVVRVPVAWKEVRQLAHCGATNYLATSSKPLAFVKGQPVALHWPDGLQVSQLTISPQGIPHVASSGGLFRQRGNRWERIEIFDNGGRAWAARDVLGVAFDSGGRLWFASRAGVGCRTEQGWKFYEGKDGLPWNDFTGAAPGPKGEVWFGTRLGAIRFEAGEFHYRQGPRWLPDDHITQIAVDSTGRAWLATAGGLG